jgi:hypothetical protein
MLRSRTLSAIAGVFALGACVVTPPTGPTVVALPPQGKALSQFQQEDGSCRQYAAGQTGYGTAAQPATQSTTTTSQLQMRYDIAYTQCMAASGNPLQAFPGGYTSYYYPGAYPDLAYYDPWFGPAVGFGFVGGFGSRFRHNSFFHHGGFSHGGFSHGGFHGGGGRH